MDKNEQKIIEALESLNALADKFLDIQCDNIDSAYVYSEDSMMDALLVFSAVIGNIVIHRMQEKGTALQAGLTCAEDMGNEIRLLVERWTKIDPRKFFN
jgi:hypothetical protein